MPKLNPEPRRALAMLAKHADDGCSEAIMLAYGFSPHLVDTLLETGLAAARTGCVAAGARQLDVTTIRITDAGRTALAKRR
jgi:hypothetical protein